MKKPNIPKILLGLLALVALSYSCNRPPQTSKTLRFVLDPAAHSKWTKTNSNTGTNTSTSTSTSASSGFELSASSVSDIKCLMVFISDGSGANTCSTSGNDITPTHISNAVSYDGRAVEVSVENVPFNVSLVIQAIGYNSTGTCHDLSTVTSTDKSVMSAPLVLAEEVQTFTFKSSTETFKLKARVDNASAITNCEGPKFDWASSGNSSDTDDSTSTGPGNSITHYLFTAADNSALTADATGVIENTTVAVVVPASTDVSALIAQFTLSDGASAAISSTAQVSGTTANDFSSNQTYTITSSDGNTQDYTVNVSASGEQANAGSWAYGRRIAVASDGTMYVCAGGGNGQSSSIQCKENDGSTWQNLSTSGFPSSDGLHYGGSVVVDSSKNIFFAYSHNDGANIGLTSVYQLSGTSWSLVGSPFGDNASGGSAFSPIISIDSNGTLYTKAADSESKMKVFKYTGSSWDNLGPLGSEGAYNKGTAFIHNNTPYYLAKDGSTDFKILQYTGSSWTDATSTNNAPGVSFSKYPAFSVVGDAGSEIFYVAFQASSDNSIKVFKYQTSTWTELASPGSTAGGSGTYTNLDLVVLNNTPYVWASSEDKILKYNGSTWEDVIDVPTATNDTGDLHVQGSFVYFYHSGGKFFRFY